MNAADLNAAIEITTAEMIALVVADAKPRNVAIAYNPTAGDTCRATVDVTLTVDCQGNVFVTLGTVIMGATVSKGVVKSSRVLADVAHLFAAIAHENDCVIEPC